MSEDGRALNGDDDGGDGDVETDAGAVAAPVGEAAATSSKPAAATNQNGRNAVNGAGDASLSYGGARPKVKGARRRRRTREEDERDGANGDQRNGVSDSSDSDMPRVANGNGVSGDGANESEDDSDAFVYAYRGGSNGRTAVRVEADDPSDQLSADLPKSFYPDTGSESEGGGAGVPGVSGAGQSNLSTEVAALLQSEMSARARQHQATRGRGGRRRRRGGNQHQQHQHLNGAVASGQADAVAAGANGAHSPEFLEMDFEDSGDSGDSDCDSGRGADENVTETNEEDSEADPAAGGETRGAVGGSEAAGGMNGLPHDGNPWGSPSPSPSASRRTPAVPRDLPLAASRGGDVLSRRDTDDDSVAAAAAAAAPAGMTSAPAVTPVREDLSQMTRSRSLNWPLAASATAARASASGSECPVLMARGESDPTVSSSGTGPPGDSLHVGGRGSSSFDASVNMQVCGSRLSQREAMLFQPIRPSKCGTQVRSSNHGDGSCCDKPAITEKTMIWTEQEALRRQTTQIGVSACGATAVVNVLAALNHMAGRLSEGEEAPPPPIAYTHESVNAAVGTRLRANGAPCAEYLFSRSGAGCIADDILRAVSQVTNGAVVGRFFPLYPPRRVDLSAWLQRWIRRGAVPVVTINPQRAPLRPGQTLPDAWHHQMVFGVGPGGVYLTNPLQQLPEEDLLPQLSSPSTLLVRRGDVVSRYFSAESDLERLTQHPDERWDELNVLGQVTAMLREFHDVRTGRARGSAGAPAPPEHVEIPADYRSGVALVIRRSSPHAEELLSMADFAEVHGSVESPQPGLPDESEEEKPSKSAD